MENRKKKRNQIAFDIDPDFHKKLKMIALENNMTLNLWIQTALIEAYNKQKK